VANQKRERMTCARGGMGVDCLDDQREVGSEKIFGSKYSAV